MFYGIPFFFYTFAAKLLTINFKAYEFKISSKIGCMRLICAIFEWNSFTESLRTRAGEEGCGRRCRQREALSASQQHQRKQRIFMAQQRNSYGQRR